MVLETSYRRLFSFIPTQVLAAKSLACDPLPPRTTVNQYDQEFFKDIEDLYSSSIRSRRQRVNDERRLAQFIPDAAFRHQLQVMGTSFLIYLLFTDDYFCHLPKAFFEAHPHFAQRFPGGILQFAQMAGQLPPDVLEDLMLVEAINGPADGAMPGGLENVRDGAENMVEVNFVQGEGPLPPPDPGARINEVEEEEDDEVHIQDQGEEEEEEEEISVSHEKRLKFHHLTETSILAILKPMPRVIRNILGRLMFWGRNNTQVDQSSSEEDVLLDDDGVD